jgi:hypothetical protein
MTGGVAFEILSGASRRPMRRSGTNTETTVSCRLRETLPCAAWMAPLTMIHPSVRVEVVDWLEVPPQRVLFDVQLPSSSRVDLSEELGRLPDVETMELIDAKPQAEVYRVLFTGQTFTHVVKRLRILRRFPFPIQDGVTRWLVVGPESRVRGLISTHRRSRIVFSVDSVRRGCGPIGGSCSRPVSVSSSSRL